MISITDTQARLLVELLELAENEFSNHGCNDFELFKCIPDLEKRRELIKAYHEWNGDPETFEEDTVIPKSYEYFYDYALMGYLAHKVKEQLEQKRG